MIAAVIFYLCVRPSLPALTEVVRNNEVCVDTNGIVLGFLDVRNILGHFFFFALLSFTLAWETFRTGCEFRTWRMACLSVVLPCFYGGLLELVQEYFFPPRSAEWLDFFVDLMGVLLGYALASFSVPKLDCIINKQK